MSNEEKGLGVRREGEEHSACMHISEKLDISNKQAPPTVTRLTHEEASRKTQKQPKKEQKD
jgi:hypothetical protein